MALFQAGQRLLIRAAVNNSIATLLEQRQPCMQKQWKAYATGRHRHLLIRYAEANMLRSTWNFLKDFYLNETKHSFSGFKISESAVSPSDWDKKSSSLSQNHRMAEVGRDLWRSFSPTPLPSRVTRIMSRQVLSISREGNSTASVGNLFQCSVTLTAKCTVMLFRKVCLREGYS